NFRELHPPVASMEQRTLERRTIRRRKGDVPPPRASSSAPSVEPAMSIESTMPVECAVPIESAPDAPPSSPSIEDSAPPASAPLSEPVSRRRNMVLIGVTVGIVLLAGATLLVRTVANRAPPVRTAPVPISTGIALPAKAQTPAIAESPMQAVATSEPSAAAPAGNPQQA